MSTIARQQVIDLIEELPSEALPDLVRFIEFLRFKSGRDDKATAAGAEARLTAIVRRRLPPEEQRRLDHLRARKDAGQLTPEEHAELLAYVERVEREDAERAEALVELARLRGVPVAALVRDFERETDIDAG